MGNCGLMLKAKAAQLLQFCQLVHFHLQIPGMMLPWWSLHCWSYVLQVPLSRILHQKRLNGALVYGTEASLDQTEWETQRVKAPDSLLDLRFHAGRCWKVIWKTASQTDVCRRSIYLQSRAGVADVLFDIPNIPNRVRAFEPTCWASMLHFFWPSIWA